MTVKANQPALLAGIENLFDQLDRQPVALNPRQCLSSQQVRALGEPVNQTARLKPRQARTVDVAHGRIETRILQCLVLPHGDDVPVWPAAAQVFRVQRISQNKKTGKKRSDVVCGISSLPDELAGAKQLLTLCRGHWGIENRSHHVRDTTFDEDRSRVRTKGIPQLMAALRNTAINLLRLDGRQNIAAATRTCAAKQHLAAKLILESWSFE